MVKAGDKLTATWQPWGPMGQGFEDTSLGGAGLLSVDYTTGVDTRWVGRVTLGPLVTVLSCSAAGGSAGDANGFALSNTMNATKYIYVIRGTKWAKIKASDMSLVSDGTETALGEAATSILKTTSANGTEEISIGMANTAYRVITAVSGTATDTHSANSGSKKIRILKKASPADTYAGLGQDASGNENTVYHNVLTGSVTMASPNWVTRATITDIGQFTGFGMSDNTWVLGTDEGPLTLDNDFLRFKEVIPELDANTNHCVGMDNWTYTGLVIPLANGLLTMKNEGRTTEFVGLEKFPYNSSTVAGSVTAVAGTTRWLYLAVQNVDGEVYIVAARPRQAGEYLHSPLSFFPIAKPVFSYDGAHGCNFLGYIGTYGSRTRATVIGGAGSNVMYFSEGLTDSFTIDPGYEYCAGATLFLTELRRYANWEKQIDWVQFETADCSSTETIQLRVLLDGVDHNDPIGAPVTTNGMQRISLSGQHRQGKRLQPYLTFSRGSDTTASPKIISPITMGYTIRPLRVDGREVDE